MKARLLAAFLFCGAGSSWAAPGALDTTFSGDGMLTTAIGTANDAAHAIAVQPDGKMVAAGYSNNGANNEFALVRYSSDGSVDTTFDGDGIVTTPIGADNDIARSVAVQADGKIVVAGYSHNGTNNDFALARYNSDGSLDTSFDADGIVTTAVGASNDYAYSIAIQPDGKLVVAGVSSVLNNDVALVRYNSDGSLDTSFGGDGIVTTPIGAGSDSCSAVAVQPDGKLVCAGSSWNGASYGFALVRYHSDGSLDTSFDTDGIVTTDMGAGEDAANAIALQPDGKIVVAGYSNNGTDNDFALVRYNSNGTLDTTFDTDGIVTTAVGSSWDWGRAIAVQPDGKLLVAGESLNATVNYDVALVRYNSDGSLDTTFDTDGIVTTAVGASHDYAYAIAVQPDGSLVAAGYSSNGSNNDIALVRYVAMDAAWDLAPTAFSFTDQSGVAVGSTFTSEVITVAGLDAGIKVPLRISGGSYSLNSGAYTSDTGWVQNGDTISVRHTSSASSLTATNTTLTYGGLVAANNATVPLGGTVSDVFTSTTGDATPDAFTFTDQTDVTPGATVTSAAITVTGILIAAPVSITGGEYSVGCTGVFTSTAGSVASGDTVCVRHTAAAAYSSAVNTTLTIGGISDVFTSTTLGNAVPDPFTFTDVTGQPLDIVVTSAAITVTGTTLSSAIAVTGGEYSIGCTDSFTTASGTIANGETVCVRHTTSNAYAATVDTTLTIGGVSDIFSSTTVELDGTPDAFAFLDQADVAPGAVVESDAVTITGINGPTAVSVAGGEYSVGCTGVYTATAGTLSNNDSVCVRHTAASTHAATINTTLTVGGVSDVFSSTTEAAPASGGGGAIGWMGLLLLGLFGAVRARRPAPACRWMAARSHEVQPRLGA